MRYRWWAETICGGWMFLLLTYGTVAGAEVISIEMANQLTASAEYRAGNSGLPAVLILHGFLQTRDFSTVARLSDSLHELGYSVLAPTLSLGISTRAKSLPCEAIQTHSMQSSVDELRTWVRWLTNRGHQQIMLVGHSAGSVMEVAYLSQQPDPAIQGAILISLSYFGQGKAAFENAADADRARQALAQDNNELDHFGLAFCKEYLAHPRDFLSYYHWSKQHTLDALQATQVPVSVIIGEADDRIDREWIATLQQHRARVIMVPGANHFFDAETEFDLLNEVEAILSPR